MMGFAARTLQGWDTVERYCVRYYTIERALFVSVLRSWDGSSFQKHRLWIFQIQYLCFIHISTTPYRLIESSAPWGLASSSLMS